MKRFILSCWLLCVAAFAAHAEDIITTQTCELRAGGSEAAIVTLSTDVENYRGFQADVILPEGIGVTAINDAGRGIETENVDVNKRFGKAEVFDVEGVMMHKQTVVFAMSCNFRAGEGSLLSLTFTADASVSAGTYTGYLKNVLLSYSTGTTVSVAESSFTIEVYEGNARIALDENSTTPPASTEESVDVTLHRSIKAGTWSTIVLPFAATGEQVKAAFGDDVELAEFTAWESEEDDDGAIVAINVTFGEASADDGIDANTPMLIRIGNEVAEATFEGVMLEPEEEPVVQVGKRAAQRGYFYGTYVPKSVPEENLFLSGNKFWYSTGATTIKGYRGYFEFRDVLDAYYDVAGVKFNLFIGGVATDVRGIDEPRCKTKNVFNIAGQRMDKVSPANQNSRLQRGVYIVDGHKVVVK